MPKRKADNDKAAEQSKRFIEKAREIDAERDAGTERVMKSLSRQPRRPRAGSGSAKKHTE